MSAVGSDDIQQIKARAEQLKQQADQTRHENEQNEQKFKQFKQVGWCKSWPFVVVSGCAGLALFSFSRSLSVFLSFPFRFISPLIFSQGLACFSFADLGWMDCLAVALLVFPCSPASRVRPPRDPGQARGYGSALPPHRRGAGKGRREYVVRWTQCCALLQMASRCPAVGFGSAFEVAGFSPSRLSHSDFASHASTLPPRAAASGFSCARSHIPSPLPPT